MTPINVTRGDHDNERRAVGIIRSHFPSISGIELHCDNPVARYDATVTSDSGSKSMLEIRCREGYSSDQLESWGPFINMHKLWPLVHEARSRGMSARFMVLASDGFLLYNLYCHLSDSALDGSMTLEYGKPARNVSRGQDRNDSCFAVYLRNPIKKIKF